MNDNLLYQIQNYYSIPYYQRNDFIFDIIEYYIEHEYFSENRDKCYNYWMKKFKEIF
jgi:hypothetical protein